MPNLKYTYVDTAQPFPLGASAHEDGYNFAVYSPDAHQISLCLFDKNDLELERIVLNQRHSGVHFAKISGLTPGLRYGLRASGEFAPERGLVFNENKLLLDPYAQSIDRSFDFDLAQLSYDYTSASKEKPSIADSASVMPKAFLPVIGDDFDWGEEQRPRTPWSRTVNYELHVKGLTQLHPDVPESQRGSYLALAHESVIRHLKQLGVTSVELLPIYAFMSEPRLQELNLVNYWGYNPVSFFAPDPRYAVKDAVYELKTAVKALHNAGIEVILDVVYNHTAEGGFLGPTLSAKGLHHNDFYRHRKGKPTHYVDMSGCGNTVNVDNFYPLKLIMDSMRHWMQEYHIDGFRFDLAAALGRENPGFSSRSAFFKAIAQDPLLSTAKLIAEPWDIGEGGYQLGHFPDGWYECNDKFRDTVKAYWRGDSGNIADFATRVMGSRDVLQKGALSLSSSINYIAYHDGFTLHDLVTYKHRHNLDNGEQNRDGHGNNLSNNYGVEGETTDPFINRLRQKQKRNLLATLFLSQGAVHFLGGDEFCRTQKGNNNAYCQDSDLSWVDWSLAEKESKHLEFVQTLVKIRQASTLFHDLTFTPRELASGPAHSDRAHWHRVDGAEMSIDDWHSEQNKTVGVLLTPAACRIDHQSCDEYFYIIFNADKRPYQYKIPHPSLDWELVFDTSEQDGLRQGRPLTKDSYTVDSRSVVLLAKKGWSSNIE